MANFSIDEFMARVDNLGGPVKSNKFSVEVTKPRSMLSSVTADTINFLAMNVSLPGKTLATTEYRYGGQFSLSVPYEITLEPVTIKVMNTGNHTPRIFWNDWFNHIQNMTTYNMQYYEKFVGTVELHQYLDEAETIDPSNASYSVTLFEAYPKGMSAIEVGWENAELQDFEIDMQYSWWTASGAAGVATASAQQRADLRAAQLNAND
jgi:hypothetical protein